MPETEAQPKLKEVTVKAFADNFYSHLQDADPKYAEFRRFAKELKQANPKGLDDQTFVNKFVEAYPQTTQRYKLTDWAGAPKPAKKFSVEDAWNLGTTPLAGGLKEPAKAIGTIGEGLPSPKPGEKPQGYVQTLKEQTGGTAKMAAGFAQGVAEFGIDLTSPATASLLVANKFKVIPKVVQALMVGKFSIDMIESIAGDFPAAYKAAKEGNYSESGRLLARAVGDTIMLKGPAKDMVERYKGSKPVAGAKPGETKAAPPPEAMSEELKAVKGTSTEQLHDAYKQTSAQTVTLQEAASRLEASIRTTKSILEQGEKAKFDLNSGPSPAQAESLKEAQSNLDRHAKHLKDLEGQLSAIRTRLDPIGKRQSMMRDELQYRGEFNKSGDTVIGGSVVKGKRPGQYDDQTRHAGRYQTYKTKPHGGAVGEPPPEAQPAAPTHPRQIEAMPEIQRSGDYTAQPPPAPTAEVQRGRGQSPPPPGAPPPAPPYHPKQITAAPKQKLLAAAPAQIPEGAPPSAPPPSATGGTAATQVEAPVSTAAPEGGAKAGDLDQQKPSIPQETPAKSNKKAGAVSASPDTISTVQSIIDQSKRSGLQSVEIEVMDTKGKPKKVLVNPFEADAAEIAGRIGKATRLKITPQVKTQGLRAWEKTIGPADSKPPTGGGFELPTKPKAEAAPPTGKPPVSKDPPPGAPKPAAKAEPAAGLLPRSTYTVTKDSGDLGLYKGEQVTYHGKGRDGKHSMTLTDETGHKSIINVDASDATLQKILAINSGKK